MASNTLSGAGVSPANTKDQLLHIGIGTLGAGAVVRLGNGTATPLTISSAGISVEGALNVSGDVTIGGSVTAKGVPVFRRLTADVTAPTTTQVNIANFDFVPVNGAVYQVEMSLIATSAATTTGVQIVNSGGSGSLVMAEPGTALGISAIGGTYASLNSPSSSSPFGIRLAGVFVAGSTDTLKFDVKSEIASSAVAIKAGSVLKITRIS